MALESFPRPLSYDDYAAIDDGQRYQVIEGVLFLMTSPSRRHQRVLLRLAQQLANFLDAHPIGEVYMAPFDVVLRAEAPANVFQPDLLVILQDQASILTRANVQGADVTHAGNRGSDHEKKAPRVRGLVLTWF